MNETLSQFFADSGKPGTTELLHSLRRLLGDTEDSDRLTSHSKLGDGVYRVQVGVNGAVQSVVVKCLDPDIAERNRLVAERWLPAIGLAECGPPLRAAAAERSGRCIWHIYEDLGDWGLASCNPDRARVKAVVETIARMHARFTEHPLLGECRLWGCDFGPQFFAASVRDAIRSMEALLPPKVRLTSDLSALRDRLLRKLYGLQEEEGIRTGLIRELGGRETLLHGDLWPKNTMAIPTGEGLQVRLIDWDHAGVGPVGYDLSTFLLRFAPADREEILDLYRQAPETPPWRISSILDLNLLFETAEQARLANSVIWPALAAWETQAEWAFERLAAIDEWFGAQVPVLRP